MVKRPAEGKERCVDPPIALKFTGVAFAPALSEIGELSLDDAK